VKGNPLQDLRVFQNQDNLHLIMKGGRAYKQTLWGPPSLDDWPSWSGRLQLRHGQVRVGGGLPAHPDLAPLPPVSSSRPASTCWIGR